MSQKCSVVHSKAGDGVAPDTLPRDAEVRMQRFSVISIMQDYTGSLDQPAIIVWDAFDTEEEATTYAKDSVKHSDIHIDVVCMYEWLFPSSINLEEVREEYRDEKLSEIMHTKKTEKKEGRRIQVVV